MITANDGLLSHSHDDQDPDAIDIANSTPSAGSDIDDEDADVRHRTTWSAAYKPPKLSIPGDFDPTMHEENNRDWQAVVRSRNVAATLIQRSIRGMLVRQRLLALFDAALIIQPCMRRYLARKRYLNYTKIKRSYYPGRWERSHMMVPI